MEELIKGKFHAISSFTIKARSEFYIIGKLIDGEVQADWFANIRMGPVIVCPLKIKQIEIVEMTDDTTEYLLLVIEDRGNNFFSPFLNVGISSEMIEITIEGEEWIA